MKTKKITLNELNGLVKQVINEITENKLNTLRKSINESNEHDYRREVEVKVYAYNATYKGREISDIGASNIPLKFLIDMEVRSWGVKDVSLYGIRGPEYISMTIDYYTNEKGDYESESIDVKLDWDTLETNDTKGEGIITIGDELQIELSNDESGNLVVSGMSIETYSL